MCHRAREVQTSIKNSRNKIGCQWAAWEELIAGLEELRDGNGPHAVTLWRDHVCGRFADFDDPKRNYNRVREPGFLLWSAVREKLEDPSTNFESLSKQCTIHGQQLKDISKSILPQLVEGKHTHQTVLLIRATFSCVQFAISLAARRSTRLASRQLWDLFAKATNEYAKFWANTPETTCGDFPFQDHEVEQGTAYGTLECYSKAVPNRSSLRLAASMVRRGTRWLLGEEEPRRTVEDRKWAVRILLAARDNSGVYSSAAWLV